MRQGKFVVCQSFERRVNTFMTYLKWVKTGSIITYSKFSDVFSPPPNRIRPVHETKVRYSGPHTSVYNTRIHGPHKTIAGDKCTVTK